MDSIVAFINDIGGLVQGSVGTLITLNYIIGQTVVGFARWILQYCINLVFNLGRVLHILIEDFGIFVEEISETIFVIVHALQNGVDHVVDSAIDGAYGLHTLASRGSQHLCTSVSKSLALIYDASDWVGKTLYLALSSMVMGIRQIPQVFTSGLSFLHHCLARLFTAIGDGGRNLVELIVAAPLQVILGFVSVTMFSYLSYRTAHRFIVERQITSRHVARWSFQALCLIYVLFININMAVIRLIANSCYYALSHLHVPRFHHAGDSDEEDAGDPDTIPADAMDDSDAEDAERREARQRTYNLLIKRRDERRTRRSKSKSNRANNGNQDDVEDLLLEQVEREREDKLCVICQDREKCIMILPCRHLCICQDCQVSLLQRADQAHHSCPICRKNVKQTIKVYL